MALPIIFVAALSALSVPLFGMSGTAATAGFGLVGFVCPLAAMNTSDIGVIGMLLWWIVVPFGLGFVAEWFCRRVIKLYDKNIFKFDAE